MKVPLFSEALKTEVINGRVFIDLEQLVELIYNVSNETTIAATEVRDPALGVMAMGVGHIGKALDGSLELHKEAHGLQAPAKICGRSEPHPEHHRMVQRKVVRCPGVADDD